MEPQETVAIVGLSGTVRCNMLANVEALLNLVASSFELSALAFGLVLFLVGLFAYQRSIFINPIALHRARRKAHIGVLLIKFGLLVPAIVNWLVAFARDSELLN